MSQSKDLPDLEYIRELAKVFQRYELDEMEIETGEQRVLLRRGDGVPPPPIPVPVAAPMPMAVPAAVPAPVVATPPAVQTPTPAPEQEPEPQGDFITSPFVGTFYRAPQPDAPPFADVGQRVEAGDTVCVVEAMKLFNEIEAEFACVIEQALVDNASAVEFGTKLFRVRKL